MINDKIGITRKSEGEYFGNILEGAGVDDSAVKAALMLKFMDLTLKRNEVVNLTSITDRDEFIVNHLLDSISCFGWEEIKTAKNVVDVGAGAGFPGLPLAILYPDKEFLLMDSLNKRVEFVREAVSALGLGNVRAEHCRAEDAGASKDYRERYDLCVSRAVAGLPTLLEYCLPFVRVGGSFYAYKTVKTMEEIEGSKIALGLLGAAPDIEVREPQIIGEASVIGYGHKIFVVKKIRPTPKTYPRKAGTPKKVPLHDV